MKRATQSFPVTAAVLLAALMVLVAGCQEAKQKERIVYIDRPVYKEPTQRHHKPRRRPELPESKTKIDPYCNRVRVLGQGGVEGPASRVLVVGNTAYVGSTSGGPSPLSPSRLTIFDVTSPSSPRRFGVIDLPDAVNDIAYKDGTLFVALDNMGLMTLDVRSPKRPRVLEILSNFRGPKSSAYMCAVLAGDSVYVADHWYGLRAFGVSSSGDLRRESEVALPQYPHDVGVSDNTLCLAGGRSGLWFFDVSSPGKALKVGNYRMPGFLHKVQVVGPWAFVIGHKVGLQIIDFSNRRKPRVVTGCPIRGDTVDLVVDERRAYVAEAEGRIHIFDITEPTRPRLLTEIDAGGKPRGLCVRGRHIFVADEERGLVTLELVGELGGSSAP